MAVTSSQGSQQSQLVFGLISSHQGVEARAHAFVHREAFSLGKAIPKYVLKGRWFAARPGERTQMATRFTTKQQAIGIQDVGGASRANNQVVRNGISVDFH
jgi:hypothetical protein